MKIIKNVYIKIIRYKNIFIIYYFYLNNILRYIECQKQW